MRRRKSLIRSSFPSPNSDRMGKRATSLSLRDLAGALAVSTPTATGIVDRLVGRGDIDRWHDTEDRRVVTCYLSAQGQQHISALWLAKFEVFREIFGTLTPEELDVVAKAEEVVLKAATRMKSNAPMALALQSGGPGKR